MMNDIVFASYTVADEGVALLENVEIQEVLLPAVDKKLVQTTDTDSTPSSSQKVTHQRKGKGSHALSIAQELNWFEIKRMTITFRGCLPHHFLNVLAIVKAFQNYPIMK